MTTDTPDRLDLATMDIADDRIGLLREDFPEVFRDGKVDVEALRRAIGDWVEPENERFGLQWPGKAEAFRAIQTPSVGTLLPDREGSVDWETTGNLIIEGDNLEVLKLLQKSYYGKVKMIYIDPPYNTGNDFIYPDNYREGMTRYLEYTGQVNGEGKRLSTNTESAGRYHSNWLNMMYPRLYLARNLLRDDGVIFVSIDDTEVGNLRALMNEVFGEEQFIANVVWQKKYTRSNDAQFFSDNHDHILVAVRLVNDVKLNLLPRTDEQIAAYSNPDNHEKGPWKATPLHAKSGASTRSYTFSNGVAWTPPVGTYRRFSDDTMAKMDAGDEIWFGRDGNATPSRKTFLSDTKQGVTSTTIWPFDEVGHNHEATNELKSVLGEGVFDNPKPTRLLCRMMQLSTDAKEKDSEDVILDFFAGSGTTGHAVMKQNAADSGNRRYILVQLPEPIDPPKVLDDGTTLATIADITRERVRRAGRTIAAERDTVVGKHSVGVTNPVEGEPGSAPAVDAGFRSYRLGSSNFKPWVGTPPAGGDAAAQIELQLQSFTDNLVENRSPDDILAEIILKLGYELTERVERLTLAGKEVFSVAGGVVLVCLNTTLPLDAIEAMADLGPGQIVCLDSGFASDEVKVNAMQIVRSRARSAESTIKFWVV